MNNIVRDRYTKEEIDKINSWIRSCGSASEKASDVMEYKHGQLLEITKKKGSLLDWDEWQHLQICIDKELPFETAMLINNMLWENDIEILELNTEKSKAYYNRKINQRNKENDRGIER